MKKQLLLRLVLSIAFIMLLSGTAFAPEDQKAWLRMYATDSIYVGPDDDPWITDSYVVSSGSEPSISLDITIENIKNDANVAEIVVPIVTNNTGVISSIEIDGVSISPLDWTTGRLYMTADDGYDLGELPPHGIYDDPAAYWLEYRSGENLTADGTPGDSMVIGVTIIFTSADPDPTKIHFDAYGWTEDSGKKPVIIDDTRDAVFAPFSKDITILVPELAIGLIATTSAGLCGYLLLKRKVTKT